MKTHNLAPASFLALLDQMGVKYQTQSGWHKVEIGKAKCYVPRARVVTTVHISGFVSALGVPLAKPPTAKVTGELKTAETPIAQLRLFADLIAEMRALPADASSSPEKPASAPKSEPLFIDPSQVLLDPSSETRIVEA